MIIKKFPRIRNFDGIRSVSSIEDELRRKDAEEKRERMGNYADLPTGHPLLNQRPAVNSEKGTITVVKKTNVINMSNTSRTPAMDKKRREREEQDKRRREEQNKIIVDNFSKHSNSVNREIDYLKNQIMRLLKNNKEARENVGTRYVDFNSRKLEKILLPMLRLLDTCKMEIGKDKEISGE